METVWIDRGGPDSKSNVASVISDFTQVGNHVTWPQETCGPQRFSFIDGTPRLAATNVNPCVYADGLKNGLAFTVAADTALRTLRIYLDAEFATIKLQAFLSDGSAAPVVNTSFDNPEAATGKTYTIVYKTASSGERLTVLLTVDHEYDWGSISLYAATLDGPAFTDVPQIATLSQASGAAGDLVTISGIGFGPTQGTSTVRFNGSAAIPIAWSDNQITVRVPAGTTSGNVVVTVAGIGSIGKAFTVLHAPTITSLIPESAAIGAKVTITGTDFGTLRESSIVTFNGVPASVTDWSSTSISVTVPQGATTGSVVVNNSIGSSNAKNFAVVSTSNIVALSALGAEGYSSLTITGAGFTDPQGPGYVTFGDVTADVISWHPTAIEVYVPGSALPGSVPVTVHASGVSSNAALFTVIPRIASISPGASPVGGSVVLSGSNFGIAGTVTFNGLEANVNSWTATSVVVIVPSLATTGPVVLTSNSVSSRSMDFQIVPLAAISAISKTSGTAGTTVTISGAHFGASADLFNGSVVIGGASAPIANWNDSRITAIVPLSAEPGAGTLAVMLAGSPSNTYGFTVIPHLDNAGTNSGGAGTLVTITGANFGSAQGSGSVQFGLCPALVKSWGSTTIIAQVPELPAGTISLTVIAAAITTNSTEFTIKPTVTTMTPASGHMGTVVRLTGGSLGSSGTVTFNGVQATTSSWTSTEIVAEVPEGATSGPVIVTSSGIATDAIPFVVVSDRPAGGPLASLMITPSSFSMIAGDSRDLAAGDDLGTPVADVVWSTTDGTIASFEEGTSTLTAHNAGQTTIIATSGNQTTHASVTVYLGATLPPGVAMWSVSAPAIQADTVTKLVATPTSTSTSTSDLFFVSRDHNGTVSVAVQGLTVDGRQLWRTVIPSPGPSLWSGGWMPDRFGGMVFASASTSTGSVISRIDGATGQLSWTYTPGASSYLSGPLAIGQDGTVYTVVWATARTAWTTVTTENHIVALDGRKGRPKFSAELPQSYVDDPYVYSGPWPAIIGPLTVMPDGSLYLEAYTNVDIDSDKRWQAGRLDLINVQSNGATSKQTLGFWPGGYTYPCQGTRNLLKSAQMLTAEQGP